MIKFFLYFHCSNYVLMRKYRYLPLTIILMLVTFSTVTYTSCKKDKCKKVSCANNGTCKDGNCICPTGYNGKICEALTRDGYTKKYVGEGIDSEQEKYPGVVLAFSKSGDDITAMKLEIFDGTGQPMNTFDVKLESNTTYSIVSRTEAENTYTGSGTISETEASLKIIVTGTSPIEFTFASMKAQ